MGIGRAGIHRRAVAVAATVAALATGTLVGSPAEAAAQRYCGSACAGKNPQTYPSAHPCGRDARTVRTFVGRGRTLQLRYSPRCETVWARLYGGQRGDKVQFEYDWNGTHDWAGDWEYRGPGTREWSNMLDDHNVKIRACIGPSWFHDDRWGCTGSY